MIERRHDLVVQRGHILRRLVLWCNQIELVGIRPKITKGVGGNTAMVRHHACDDLAMSGDSNFLARLDFGKEPGEIRFCLNNGFARPCNLRLLGVLQLKVA